MSLYIFLVWLIGMFQIPLIAANMNKAYAWAPSRKRVIVFNHDDPVVWRFEYDTRRPFHQRDFDQIRSKFGVLWFKICSANHNEILHTSR